MQRACNSTLVTVRWLKEILTSPAGNHRILDASWHLPNTGRNARAEYMEQHIPGAMFFDIDDCADKKTDMPHMIPTVEEFEDYVGGLGINNSTHVIIYDNHPQFPVFSAQRAWWTFRLFGHQKISILEGGLPKWISGGGTVTKEMPTISREKFNTSFKPHLVKSFDDIKENLDSRQFLMVDARPAGRFEGTAPEPRPDVKPGCIPHSVNMPFPSLMNVEDRTMKSPEELKQLFQNAGVDPSGNVVATCGSGISACLIALAAHVCNSDTVSIYDGSWTEWYLRAPSQLKVNVPT